jgi:hypothetical protein
MPVCLRNSEKKEEIDRVMAMREPAGRLGEIVRILKRNHQARMRVMPPQAQDWNQV